MYALRGTKFGGGKIGIGKRGRAKISSPQPPSFLPARSVWDGKRFRNSPPPKAAVWVCPAPPSGAGQE
ncbi:MAG: hypothetical protein COV62_01185, partial [Candidatus Nealsonbacteria bacterium CG11_big_fil_rev_8_21_14_0_20_35_11]